MKTVQQCVRQYFNILNSGTGFMFLSFLAIRIEYLATTLGCPKPFRYSILPAAPNPINKATRAQLGCTKPLRCSLLLRSDAVTTYRPDIHEYDNEPTRTVAATLNC